VTITVTNLDKQAFASVAKFEEETLRDGKPLRDQNLPSLQRTHLLSQVMLTIYVRFALKRRLHKASVANLPRTTVPTRKARSVRLPTGWTVRGSNPGDSEIFRTCPDQPWAHPASCTTGAASFSRGAKRPARGVDKTHPAPRLKKEYSYTSTIPPSLHGLLQGDLYLYVQLEFNYLPHRKHSFHHAISRFIAMCVYSDHAKTTNTLFSKCRWWCKQPALSSLPLQHMALKCNALVRPEGYEHFTFLSLAMVSV